MLVSSPHFKGEIVTQNRAENNTIVYWMNWAVFTILCSHNYYLTAVHVIILLLCNDLNAH